MRVAIACVLGCAALVCGAAHAVFEWSGYLEARPEFQRPDADSALYRLQFPGGTGGGFSRTGIAAELSGVFRRGDARLHFTAHASQLDDPRDSTRDARFCEAYAAWQPDSGVRSTRASARCAGARPCVQPGRVLRASARPDRPGSLARRLHPGHREPGAQLRGAPPRRSARCLWWCPPAGA